MLGKAREISVTQREGRDEKNQKIPSEQEFELPYNTGRLASGFA